MALQLAFTDCYNNTFTAAYIMVDELIVSWCTGSKRARVLVYKDVATKDLGMSPIFDTWLVVECAESADLRAGICDWLKTQTAVKICPELEVDFTGATVV